MFLPALLYDSCVVVKDGGLMLHGGIDGLAGGELHQQACLPAARGTDQHTVGHTL